jgi:uncharacterized protein (DUF2147 family)
MKISNILRLSIFAALLLFSYNAMAQHTIDGKTCVGTWKTVDDETGKARSYVKIWKKDGKYYGKIIKLLNRTADEDEDPVCTVCPGDRKNKKVIGMTIIRGMEKKSKHYGAGRILDPKKGKEYDCTIWLKDANTLKVRGWWGMVYRTQTWSRID